ncbi:FecR family protein [Chitinophaga rupis]|uniref:FecR family protein n=2 Tax=Chitinophaga rupis TaxID=573321 RepID=A0A1H8IK07_9BACT|nr:FecR family protein [Chitinophaga rupis]
MTHTQQQNEHLWQLMFEKVAGVISTKDLHYLEAQLREDESMQEAFHAIQISFGHEDLERLKEDEDWIDILSVIKTRPRTTHQHRFGKYTVAAVLAGLLVSSAGLYFLTNRKTTPPLAAVTAGESPQAVVLQLADSKTVLLSDKTTNIRLGDVQLHNAADQLTFSSPDNFSVYGGQHTLIVPVAKSYRVTLSDGTAVWLNADTRLQFPFSFNGSSREITLLSGEAFIEVAPDAGQPFIVHTPNSTVQVLGTAFNINAYNPKQVRLSLVSGSVKMNTHGAAVVVKPGMEAVYTPPEGLYTQSFDEKTVLSWKAGKHFFDKASLSDICLILYRHMGIKAVIDSSLRRHDIHFNGMVDKHKPIQEFMDDVKNMTGVDYYFDAQGILHFR